MLHEEIMAGFEVLDRFYAERVATATLCTRAVADGDTDSAKSFADRFVALTDAMDELRDRLHAAVEANTITAHLS